MKHEKPINTTLVWISQILINTTCADPGLFMTRPLPSNYCFIKNISEEGSSKIFLNKNGKIICMLVKSCITMLNIPAQISQITDHCWSLQNMLIFFMKSWLEYKMHILLFCMMLSCDTVVNYLVVDSVGIQSMILSQPLANDNVYVFVWKLFTINCFMIILNCFTPNIFTTLHSPDCNFAGSDGVEY